MTACRICFDSERSLLAPCKCDGSIKYVHSECLIRWDQMRPPMRQGTCELCKEPYTFQYNYPLETDILSAPVRALFLINPSWHIASGCICTVLMTRISILSSPFLYFCTHLAYQCSYLVFMKCYIHCTIQRLQDYWTHWRTYSLALCIHSVLIAMTISLYLENFHSTLVLVSVFNQCYLCIYPFIHTTILDKMNLERTFVVGNRVH